MSKKKKKKKFHQQFGGQAINNVANNVADGAGNMASAVTNSLNSAVSEAVSNVSSGVTPMIQPKTNGNMDKQSAFYNSHADEYRMIRHDLIRVVVVNGLFLVAVLALYYANRSNPFLEAWYQKLF